jgi:hypothetical protein
MFFIATILLGFKSQVNKALQSRKVIDKRGDFQVEFFYFFQNGQSCGMGDLISIDSFVIGCLKIIL